jgi:hypothetical protein
MEAGRGGPRAVTVCRSGPGGARVPGSGCPAGSNGANGEKWGVIVGRGGNRARV